jgi:hypothetical protein
MMMNRAHDRQSPMRPEEVARKLEEEFALETIELAEPLPIHVTAGPHMAVVEGIRRVTLTHWKRDALIFRFRLTELSPANGVSLPGYVNLGETGMDGRRPKSGKPKPNGKLGRWWRIIADYTGGRRDRVVLSEFKHFLFEVLVDNVRTDNRQHDIPQAGQGQAVFEIAAIVQHLTKGAS